MFERNTHRLFVLAGITAALALADNNSTESINIAVEGGTASFVANTNVAAISVKGKSAALKARVNLRRSQEGLQLDRIEALIPVKSLVTGMGVRDDHMRKYIFTTADGKTPDIRFQGENATCSSAGSGHESTCQVAGSLSIRGVARPFTIPLKIREEGTAFKAIGDTVVKLSEYGIEQPSQFGVKTTNEVQLHFDFTAKQASAEVAALGGAK